MNSLITEGKNFNGIRSYRINREENLQLLGFVCEVYPVAGAITFNYGIRIRILLKAIIR